MTIGNKISELRKRANLSQEQLAEKLGVTRQTISKWELDETKPDIKQAEILVQIFKIDLDELVGRKRNVYKKRNIGKIIFYISYAIFALYFICNIVSVIFSFTTSETSIITTLNCSIDNEKYQLKIQTNLDDEIIALDGDDYYFEEIKNFDFYENSDELVEDVIKHFENKGGSCK